MKKVTFLLLGAFYLVSFFSCKQESRVATIHSVNYDKGEVIHDQVRPVTYDEKDRLISMEGITVQYLSDDVMRGVFPRKSHAFILVDSFTMKLKDGKVTNISYTETPIPGTGIYEPMKFEGKLDYNDKGIFWTCQGVGLQDTTSKVKFYVNYLTDNKGRLKEVVFDNGGIFSGRYVYEYGKNSVKCSDIGIAASIFGNPAISTIEYFLYSFANMEPILKELPSRCSIVFDQYKPHKPTVIEYSYTKNNGRVVHAMAERNGNLIMSYNFVY